jgi:hypothetical protein
VKEGTKQELIAGGRAGVALGSMRKLLDVDSGVVRQWIHLQIRPEHLHRVQLGSIGWEEGDVDGTAAPSQLRPGRSMDVQAVPHDDDRRPKVAAKIPDKAKNVWGDDVLIGKKRKVKSHPAAPRRYGQCRDHRDALTEPHSLIEDGGIPDRRPGATNQGSHQKPALIEEDQSGLQSPGVFFTRGHSVRTQPRIAASSRSLARRWGFCGLKPRERSRRLMWLT